MLCCGFSSPRVVTLVHKVPFLCVVLVKCILCHGVLGRLCVFVPLHIAKGVSSPPPLHGAALSMWDLIVNVPFVFVCF